MCFMWMCGSIRREGEAALVALREHCRMVRCWGGIGLLELLGGLISRG